DKIDNIVIEDKNGINSINPGANPYDAGTRPLIDGATGYILIRVNMIDWEQLEPVPFDIRLNDDGQSVDIRMQEGQGGG
ncbi:MAG: hypothetical protein ABII23_07885, partial [bacterium]